MSNARRAYDLVRGYVNREFDRLSNVAQSPEEKELEEALGKQNPPAYGNGPVPSPEERELDASPTYINRPSSTKGTTTQLSPEDSRELACKVLGVPSDAPFQDIRKVYETLNQRSDPTRFPEGSEERIQAVLIQRRIQWAYKKLTENLDSTEMRFRTLEIE